MKLLLAIGAAAMLVLPAGTSSAEPSSAAPLAVTTLDDTRACAPLARGGYAVATGGGLAIVDKDGGVKSITSLDGLPDTRVHSVTESADGLWVGTEGGAALVAINAAGAPSIARTVAQEAAVHSVVASSASSAIFIGTWGRGVFRLADKSSTPTLVPTTGSGKHVAAMVEHAGVIHVAYSDGPMTRLEAGSLHVIAGTPTHGQALASFGTRVVVGDLEGLFRVDPTTAPTMTMSSLASVDARGVTVIGGDRLLVATYGSGLLASTSSSGAALRAETGVPRWVKGVAARGASRCAATTEGLFVSPDAAAPWRKIALGQGPQSNDVTTLAANDDGRVVVGTFDHGASVMTNTAKTIQRVTGLEPTETVNASAWQGNALWLGTAHGLVRVDAATLAVARRVRATDGLPSSIVRAVLVLSKDRLLVGTEEGPALIDIAHGDRVLPVVATEKKKGVKESLASPMHATWALAQAPDGTLFIGTASGLYWGKAGDSPEAWERASLSTSDLKDDWVTALAVKPAAAGGKLDVFAGTYSGGVTHLVFDGSSKRTSATHLAGGYVNPDGLMIRGGDLYASTMDGLLTRSMTDDTASKWQAHASWATGKDVTSTRVVGSALWVASRRGLVIVP